MSIGAPRCSSSGYYSINILMAFFCNGGYGKI